MKHKKSTRIKLLAFLSVLGLLGFPQFSLAEKIEFPDEELETETVFPRFDRPDVVRNKTVPIAGRTEIGIVGGWTLNEPFFNTAQYGLSGTYHFNENSGLNVYAVANAKGYTSYATQLNELFQMDFGKAPAPQYIVLGNYEWTAFYGKMSITKSFIMNLSLYGLVGGGIVAFEGFTSPALDLGLGQRFYFNKTLALRFDLRMVGHQAPNPISKDLKTLTTKTSASEFEKGTYFATILDFGVVFLF